MLGRSHSSILDEFERNSVGGRYDPRKADHKAYARKKYARYQGMRIAGNGALQKKVEALLYDDQSPAAIAGWLKKRQCRLPPASRDTVYSYIKSPYGRKIEAHRLRKRRRKGRKRAKVGRLKDRMFINQRPAYINKRTRIGDAEGDFIVSGKSGKGVLLVIVDRKARTSFLERIVQPSCAAVTEACKRIKQRYPEWRSMTTDNDLLFQHHNALAAILGIRIYFCHPYHSWEKGSVENVNKHIRKTIPKGSDISRHANSFIRKLEAKLNRRIMECLAYRTPREVLQRYRKRKKRSRA